MDVKAAIQAGDVLTLRRLLREEPSRANELIHWGGKNPCITHPLHFVSDMLFQGTLPKGTEVALLDAGGAARTSAAHMPFMWACRS